MKAHHTKWILMAAAAFFLFTANAWADGKRGQGHRRRGVNFHSAGQHRPNHHVDIRPYPRHQRPHHYRPHRRPHRHGHYCGHDYHHGPRHHHYRPKVHHVQVFPPPLLLPPLPPFFWPHH